MPDPTSPAPIDTNALATAIAGALGPVLKTAIAEANQPVADALGKLQAPTPAPTPTSTTAAAGDAGKAKPLTSEDVQRAIADALKAHAQTTQQTAAREQFQATKLKDLPTAYRNQLGTDPTKWAAEEQEIRKTFRDDLAAQGFKPADVGANDAGGKKPGEVVDISKLNAVEAIAQGLKDAKPQGQDALAARDQAAAARAAATRAGAAA